MQVKTFSDGSFVAHRVTLIGSVRRYSIWFKADGTLADAQAIDHTNRATTIRPGTPTWTGLARRARSIAAAHRENVDA